MVYFVVSKSNDESDLAVLFVWLPWSIIVRDMEFFSDYADIKLKS